jgi:hypothetical protein
VRWLTSQPVWLLVAGSLALALLTAGASRVLAAAIVPAGEADRVYSVAAPLMPALGASFAVLTALTLASEAGYLRSAQDIVSREAAGASRLAWASTSPGVDSAAVQDALDDYLRATREHEWGGADAAEAADESVSADLAALERVVRGEAAQPELGTPSSTELLASLDAVTMGRRERIAADSRLLPGLYVATLVVSGVALIANAGALAFRTSVRTSLLVAGLACVVGLSLALLLAIAAPWEGGLVATGDPIDAVVRDLEAGFFTP